MKESCVCCQAVRANASGENANLVLLYTLVGGEVAVANVVEALCKKHGAALDRMVYKTLVPGFVPPARRKRRRVVTDK